MSQKECATRDVTEAELGKKRRRHREPGTVPYPAKHCKASTPYDNWNQMFLKNLCRDITMHQFDVPPSRVLDLGCGSGLWIVEAALHWKNTHFVGLDNEEIQPNLLRLGHQDVIEGAELRAMSDRVRWQKGNLLEKLPFEDASFDFVRISNIALGVPEDEWPDLLQEVARILRPDGVLEIIEDDLIFPTGSGPNHRQLFENQSIVSVPFPIDDPSRKSEGDVLTATVLSLNSPSSSNSYQGALSSTSSVPTSHRPVDDPTLEPTNIIHPSSHQASTIRRALKSQREAKSVDDLADYMDPQDHSKLKLAWHNLLHNKWISPKPLSMIPLYLSGEFGEVRSHPTLRVPIPPNSDGDVVSSIYSGSEPGFMLDLRAHFIRKRAMSMESQSVSVADSTSSSVQSVQSVQSGESATMYSWANMHLARAVNMIESCKEAIWEEYCKFDLMFPDMEKYDLRDEFEAAWKNWHCDMVDRIGARSKVNYTLGWPLPFEIAQELPDWRIWRMRLGKVSDPDLLTLVAEATQKEHDEDICRCVKGFVAWKRSETPIRN